LEQLRGSTTEQNSAVSTYPQKYLLQRRNPEGFLIKVETFTQPVSPEEVLDKYGSGYYVLKSTKPRFKTIWKQQLGEIEQAREVESLKKNAKYLTYGLVGVGAVEAAGFGLTHLRFCGLEERQDKMEVVLQTFKPNMIRCGACGKPLDSFLQKFCSQCGVKLDWPRKRPLNQLNEPANQCLNCKLPLLSHQIYCPHCGQPRPTPVSYELKREQTLGGLSG
jgi:hypothetical protein